MPFNASTFTPPLRPFPLSRWDGRAFPFVQQGFQGVLSICHPIADRRPRLFSQLIDDSSDHSLQGFSCPAVPASGPLAPVGYRPGLLRSLPHQVAPRYSQSQSQRKRTRQRRRTYYGTSHTWGLPSPRRLFILPSRPTRAATSRIRTWLWWLVIRVLLWWLGRPC